jgi:putative ABC transport system ATP-binding protein
MSDTALIRLSGITKTYGQGPAAFQALKGIDLAIEAGDFVAIMGPSGSGKSEDALGRLRRDTIGIVFQDFHLVPTMTALENVAVPLELAGSADADARARTWLERVGLGRRGHHYPRQLSGGEQQRVAIARAFAGEPKLLMADEPTGNLDGATGVEVAELMFRLNREHGTTLVLVTHDLSLAGRCGRRLSLAAGKLVRDEKVGSDSTFHAVAARTDPEPKKVESDPAFGVASK